MPALQLSGEQPVTPGPVAEMQLAVPSKKLGLGLPYLSQVYGEKSVVGLNEQIQEANVLTAIMESKAFAGFCRVAR